MKTLLSTSLLLALSSLVCFSQAFETTKDLPKQEGFFNFYYNEYEDRIFLEVKELEREFLYVYSLSTGLGSNDIGLDRGQLGREQVVYFKKAGNKLLLVQPNLKYRANTSNRLEKLSVEQAFAKSVLFGFPILETDASTHLIDLTGFLMQDAHDVAGTLKDYEQGDYKLDLSKSALEMTRSKAFPKNVEFEAFLTFAGQARGNHIKSVAPNPDLVSVVEHHSFIQLPDEDYTPREFTPGCGSYPITYLDYSTPIHEPITQRLVTRHRLKKKNPTATLSEAVEPIIYYLDNGTPEPVRTALLEGGRWWNEAFEAIGYKDAFQVKILPEDADPMDVRYNVIQWVHRSTRGWSYGGSVIDPRTGEILKGHVSLGSLRIRQDFLIAQALMNKPFATDDNNHEPMLEMALARIRQLSAHEIGHTLGFAHNFSASSNDRASVMDYPHPKFTLNNGEIDFSDAYDTGIGEWDKVVVAYSYTEFTADQQEQNGLRMILSKAHQDGLRYISDSDARPIGGAHTSAHLWDNGTNPVAELDNLLTIRKTAIGNFSKDNIRSYEPYSVLEDVFVPLYFMHRYQSEAVVKLIGGMDYNYATKGDGQLIAEVVSAGTQRKALNALLRTLSPENLEIPQDKIALFPPRAMGYSRSRESFKGKTGVSFDAISVASSASEMVLSWLLHPERASRLIHQKGLDNAQLGLAELLDELVGAIFNQVQTIQGLRGEIQTSTQFNLINAMIQLANNDNSLPQVNAIVKFRLNTLKADLSRKMSAKQTKGTQPKNEAYLQAFIDLIDNMEELPSANPPQVPDGSPIGMDCLGG